MGGLATTSVGEHGRHVVLLHGLFGQGRNFATLAKRMAATGHRVTMVDLPNHGHSPWRPTHHYPDLAAEVATLLGEQDEPVVLVGHSMGGKVAMLVALTHPELVRGLVVVDIAPVTYPPARAGSPFDVYVAAMSALDLHALRDRAQADAALTPVVPEPGVRAFLLQSLVRDPGGDPPWRWRLNLPVLAHHLDALRTFPVPAGRTYDGPVLWLAGEHSDYVRAVDRPGMDALFPQTRLVTVKGVGHWVHSEAPEVFLSAVTSFVDRVSG